MKSHDLEEGLQMSRTRISPRTDEHGKYVTRAIVVDVFFLLNLLTY
jgi:hypothetical protein